MGANAALLGSREELLEPDSTVLFTLNFSSGSITYTAGYTVRSIQSSSIFKNTLEVLVLQHLSARCSCLLHFIVDTKCTFMAMVK